MNTNNLIALDWRYLLADKGLGEFGAKPSMEKRIDAVKRYARARFRDGKWEVKADSDTIRIIEIVANDIEIEYLFEAEPSINMRYCGLYTWVIMFKQTIPLYNGAAVPAYLCVSESGFSDFRGLKIKDLLFWTRSPEIHMKLSDLQEKIEAFGTC